ncbi:hypothetical protein SAMN04489844_1997 [Nocardioides exalbidus]|uniref:Uncharacterized protein n=1 Tax=Nocardioides exalbidus TaxID=402596 RepID=A0A1H4R7J4_9ACTN|nr:hypothetical protein [Nocardioides exalbidus]SEC27651.1 hypothetical protein SAMN04489844_1997 [Nocardioides exalbidus]
MSYAIISKTHVDALITAARRWSSSTLALELPAHVADELALTDEDADRAGFTLLITNWNTAVLGGDPEQGHVDEDEIEWMEQEYIDDGFAKPTAYAFDELPGSPAPERVLRLIASYRYQSDWEGEGLRHAAGIIDALEAAARHQLGGRSAADLTEMPGFQDTPWLPGEDDRDLFLRAGA